MADYRRVYDSRHLQADCRGPGSAAEPYARQSSVGNLYLFTDFSGVISADADAKLNPLVVSTVRTRDPHCIHSPRPVPCSLCVSTAPRSVTRRAIFSASVDQAQLHSQSDVTRVVRQRFRSDVNVCIVRGKHICASSHITAGFSK